MRAKNFRTAALAILTMAAAASAAHARGGLRTPLGEVVIRGLKIGQTYSMYKLLNLPLRVVNTGDDESEIRIETSRVSVLSPGYEEIPSRDWVQVQQSTFTIPPNREAVTDLVIAIPNDAALLGRRFQADVWSHTIDPRALQVGLRSHLLLWIDSTPPTEEELKKKFVDEAVANLDFTVLPVNAAVSDIPLGRKVDLRKERKIAVKMVNPNDRALNFRVRSIPVWESMVIPPAGSEAASNPQWLTPEKSVVKVDGNSIADIGLSLDIPDRPENRGKKYLFIVSFEVLEQKIPTRVYYRLLVDTLNAVDAGKK
ncbi:MAG: hypothetical protein HY079_06015 [Elusimicrobia bacterium]|nr:hypothetical protein [Elusimicrobiota bacterium]